MELLIELAASAKRISASSLGLFTGGFINVPLPHPVRKIIDIMSSLSLLFMDFLNLMDDTLIETGGGADVNVFQ